MRDLPPELRETVAIIDNYIQRNGSPPAVAHPPGRTWRPPDWQVWSLRALRGHLADDAAQEWEF